MNSPTTKFSRRSILAGGLVVIGASAGLLRPRADVHGAAAAGANFGQVGADGAVAAMRFSDSVGICTHPNWRKTLWGSSDWENAFIETGVQHTRGKIGRGAPGRAALGDLHRLFAHGVKICATVASEGGEFDFAETRSNIEFLADHVGAQNLSGIESANEYNNPKNKLPDWAPRLRHFQAWLYETVKTNPKVAGVPVVAPSIWGRLTNDYLELGNLQPNVDKANLHYYTGGRRPTRAGRPRSDNEGGGSGDYGIADAIRDASIVAPGKPIWITEYGYPVAGPGAPPGRHMVTETAAAKYLLRGLLDAFGEGVEKIYIYSLIDDVQRSPPRYHGLLDGSLRRRPAFYAVRNLMALFLDSQGPFTPVRLDHSLSNVTADAKCQLFYKNDGTYLLTIYRDLDSYDRRGRRDSVVPPISVGLSLAQPASRIEVFTPSIGSTATQTVTNSNSLTISVGDHVSVVKISPQAARAA